MKGCMVLISVLVSSMALHAQVEEKKVKLANGDEITQSEYDKRINLITNTCAKVGEDAYRKYSDGSVCYLGALLRARYGITPDVNTNGIVLIDGGYKILDARAEGTIMKPKPSPFLSSDSDCLVIGLAGLIGAQYKHVLMLRKVGDYTYFMPDKKSKKVPSEVIPKYEMGDRISKEAYLAATGAKSKPEPARPRSPSPPVKPAPR